MGDLTLWGLPPFSATFPTLMTADIMVLMEDKSEPSRPTGELDVIGKGFKLLGSLGHRTESEKLLM